MSFRTSYVTLSACVVCLLKLLLAAQLWCPPCTAQQLVGDGAPIPGGISDGSFNTLLDDLRGSKFFTGAAVLGYLARPYLRPKVTLLIPSDKSLLQAISFPPKDYPDLVKFHILQKNFNFKQLQLLPVGTWLPTALPSFGVQVTSNTAANFSLDTAQIISPNLCPSLISSFITCQGINAILNPKFPLPPVLAGTPKSSLAPSPSSSIFLPPSFSPTSDTPSISPSLSTSPPFFSPPSTTSFSPGATPPAPTPPSPLIPLAPPSPLTSSPLLPPPTADSQSLSPATLPNPPPLTTMGPGGFAPEPAVPSATAKSVQMVAAYMVACLGAYFMLVARHGL